MIHYKIFKAQFGYAVFEVEIENGEGKSIQPFPIGGYFETEEDCRAFFEILNEDIQEEAKEYPLPIEFILE